MGPLLYFAEKPSAALPAGRGCFPVFARLSFALDGQASLHPGGSSARPLSGRPAKNAGKRLNPMQLHRCFLHSLRPAYPSPVPPLRGPLQAAGCPPGGECGLPCRLYFCRSLPSLPAGAASATARRIAVACSADGCSGEHSRLRRKPRKGRTQKVRPAPLGLCLLQSRRKSAGGAMKSSLRPA